MIQAPARMIVCGSRDWTDYERLEASLNHIIRRDFLQCYGYLTIVYGACPTGADLMAERWAKFNGFDTEPHPADWKKHGRGAGPLRNIEMAEAGAALCVAFIKGRQSKGSWGMVAIAYQHGIPVFIVPERKGIAA